jgi:hypothetical protein
VIVSDQLVTALATAAVPTVAVLVGILINNQRLRELNQRFNGSVRTLDVGFAETSRHIDDLRDSVQADMRRMEQVIDARLKHLEEHLQR